jgi:hypothetical protein
MLSTMKMESVWSSETLISYHNITWIHKPEDLDIQIFGGNGTLKHWEGFFEYQTNSFVHRNSQVHVQTVHKGLIQLQTTTVGRFD